MDELKYWKFKAQIVALVIEQNQLEAALKENNLKREVLLKSHGYELGKNYNFNDEKLELELMKNG